MPMMGGMGASPGGGDQDRLAGQWRTAGDLFDDLPEPAGRFDGVLRTDDNSSRR
jgi:hypothetical protein